MRGAMLAMVLSLLAAFSNGQDATESRTQRLGRWSESIELDLFGEVVREVRQGFLTEEAFLTDGDALALYARALSRTGGHEEAESLLKSAKPGAATATSVQLALARLELEGDRLDAVVRRLASADPAAPLRFPDQRDAWILLGKALHRQGKIEQALPMLQQFVTRWRLHPEAPAAWHILAREALAVRDLDRARVCREQGQNLSTWHAFYKTRRIQLREKPDDPLPYFGLAQLWSSVEELDRAAEAIKSTLFLDPEFARAWALSGEIERKRGNPAPALQAYSRALELDGSLSDARFNRALLALQQKNDESARADLEIIVDGPEATAPRYLGAHLALARLLKRLGEEAAAEKRHTRYRQLGGKDAL